MNTLRSEEEIVDHWKGETSKPLVSISCITYNHEAYIEDALIGFLKQETDFPFEIIIHDDASTDQTAEIIRNYEKKYPKIVKPVYQKENQYSQGNRPTQFIKHLRTGKYIAYCEGDDYWISSKKLQLQIEYMENNPECSMCCHSAYKVNSEKKIIGSIRPAKQNSVFRIEDVINGGGGFIATNSRVVRKEYTESLPAYYFTAPVGDFPSQIHMALRGKIYYFDECFSAYRIMVKGSWTERFNFDLNYKRDYYKKIVKTLEEVNKYTNFKYSDVITKAINYRSLNLFLLENGYNNRKKNSVYRSLKLKKKVVLFLKYGLNKKLLKFLLKLKSNGIFYLSK
ncbi:MAG: glycosyltransferase [Spirochaetales bacterium]|uniref:Glycosyltransferase n=1 Tax=Candidatus Thalassospirochaeta sargassi TaxID=3119039 RepID=A0AAJ1IF09_9SPIO|nr:glycosyltransferase [Spirochaetales bacterium]